MRTPVDQVELFFSRAVELEKRAADKQESKLKQTLLTLAAYYRELSQQAQQQTRHNQQTMQTSSEVAFGRQFVARQSPSSSRLRAQILSR
jgi:molybdenum-dependent DNA-binding transcriptional regulator ModE